MSKVRLAAAAVMASCGLMLVGGAGTAAAQGAQATPLTKKIAITGQAANGKRFSGTYTIDRFVSKGDKVFAVGTLKGTLKHRRVTRKNVQIPVQSLGEAPAGTARSSQLACRILSLVLGPLDLNLLGLRVQLNQVNLLITAIPGGGLLGDLLCGITNLLNPTGLLGNTLAQVLNSLLALVPANAAAPALPR
jgi:hypothetical protein